jgi:hypothetical protein
MPTPSPSKESELPKESPLLARKTRRRDIGQATTTPLPNSTRTGKIARPHAHTLPLDACWAHRVPARAAQLSTPRRGLFVHGHDRVPRAGEVGGQGERGGGCTHESAPQP